MEISSKLFGSEGSINAQYFDAIKHTLNIFDKYLGNVPQTEETQNYGCFQYVSVDEKKFFTQMYNVIRTLEILNRRKNARFLDVGCGIGTKVFLASTLFSQAHGIEIDKNYIKIAQKILKSSARYHTENISLMERDALKYSFYKDYDAIYLYRPFHDSERQDELEGKIARDAQENAIIVGTLCRFYQLPDEIKPKMIFTNGYLKSKDNKLIEEIKQQLAL